MLILFKSEVQIEQNNRNLIEQNVSKTLAEDQSNKTYFYIDYFSSDKYNREICFFKNRTNFRI